MNFYEKYSGLKVWKQLDKAIDDLINNQDLEEKTDRCYIIGYIIKLLDEKNLIKKE